MTPMRRRNVWDFLAGALLCTTAACGGAEAPEGSETIARDIFVGTYVELRMTALRSPDGRISPSAKAEILEAKGVTEADLLEYVGVHGPRVQFMVEVWGEIDDTLRALRTREASPAS